MAVLEIKNVGKTYGVGEKATEAIADISFTVEEREFVCVVGPSGCGKTTLLKCIAGLMEPSHGTVVLRGKRITQPPEEMALVFQEYNRSLMPWSTVRNNVLMPLRHKRLTQERADDRSSRSRSRPSGSPASSTTTRGSCPAGCSSESRSPAHWRTSR